MTRLLLTVSLAATLAACATTSDDKTAHQDLPRTPTEQFSVSVTHTPDEILLAPHATGLSPAQASAVTALVGRWRDAGDGPVLVQTPAGGAAESYRSATAVQQALLGLGLADDQVRLVSYQAPASSGATPPIVVGFTRYEAHGPHCGDWDSFTKSYANRPSNNFGCAVTANFAAMIANPADLAGPRPMTPADANRRETILEKYRKGEQTSTTKDAQASGAVSSVLQ